MFARFFIDHPIFANVIAVVTMIFGAVALKRLPIERYPPIIPPTVQVRTTYPGADARIVADTVAAPLEQEVNGVEGMLYMASTSSSDGSYSLTVTFDIGTNLDLAQVQVQNRTSIAEPRLPEDVRRQGLTIKKQSPNIVLVISLTSENGEFDALFMNNYAQLRLRDELSRVKGVGDVTINGGAAYGMRIWLDPDKLRSYGLTTTDVQASLRGQNVQVAAGAVGQPPLTGKQAFQYTVTTQGRLTEKEQFEGIVLKSGDNGRLVYLRDVARVELGAQDYNTFASRSGKEASSILVYQLPGSNALDVAKGVRAKMAELAAKFPAGLRFDIPFDTTLFVEAAIHEVFKTFAEAGVLVLVVILAFLQDWRALLVPATTVPVTLLGAFMFMPALGFSINMFTLLGLVLAIGIVVDDAIVIVENASHHIENGESPHDGTIRAMDEVTGPVIGITLVLMAVFLPAALLPGITGQLYQQFALTIAATALLSAMNALTLKPVQCATYLKPEKERRNPLDWVLRLWGKGFNFVYGLVEAVYTRITRVLVFFTPLMLVVFAGLLVFTGYRYATLPTGFLPDEDQGYLICNVQLPDAASQDRTRAVVAKMNQILQDERDSGTGVENWFFLGGFSLLDASNASNAATCFIVFKEWKERARPDQQMRAILERVTMKFAKIQEAFILVLAPPAIQGLGVSGGFQMQVEDRGSVGLAKLQDNLRELTNRAGSVPGLGRVASTFRAGVPQLYLDIDRVKAEQMGVRSEDIFATLQTNLGSAYINDFNLFSRVFQVRVQADAGFRGNVEGLRRLEVRNRDGGMVPLGTLLTVKETVGPQIVQRYNLYPTAMVQGAAAKGTSSGDALNSMEKLARETFPEEVGYEWTGISYQERKVGSDVYIIFGLAVLLVYLVLAAQYESWLLPLAVILVVPLGLLGTVEALNIRKMDNNVYAQIGAVLIIALACKNAILIVEFARELRHQGKSIREAAIEAARSRFRPILMTSFAFILGVSPLLRAEGAAAASRQALGTAVFGGMITSTVLAVFFTPVFFVVMQWLSELFGPAAVKKAKPTQADSPGDRPAAKEELVAAH